MMEHAITALALLVALAALLVLRAVANMAQRILAKRLWEECDDDPGKGS